MAYEVDNAAYAEATDRKHWWGLFEKFEVGAISSAELRSSGIANKSYELGFCKCCKEYFVVKS